MPNNLHCNSKGYRLAIEKLAEIFLRSLMASKYVLMFRKIEPNRSGLASYKSLLAL